MEEVYLDNSATTKVCKTAVEKMVYMMENCYGNPSSLHTKGFEAEKYIEKSRQIVSKFIGCNTDEVYFTSGGTESNNMAIMGAVRLRKKYGNRIITTKTEHPSVLSCMKELEKQGFEVVYINPDKYGNISCEDIENVADKNTILVSVMMVNNETGSIYPIGEIKRIIKKKCPNALFHVDAVQGFGKLPLKINSIKADMLSVSSHKVHGPKGVGAIYISKGLKISPIMFGGGQEKGIRSGTHAVPNIVGFGQAVSEIKNIEENLKVVHTINSYLRERLSEIEDIVINSPDNASPYIINFSVKGIRSETMLNYLSSKGVYISSGSACAKGKRSHVLESIGLPSEIIDSSLRLSFSTYNTKDDIDIFLRYLKQGMKEIAKK